MEKKIELLAPAGDWDAFIAAVENGADAVYLGGKLFNARQFAGNFDRDNLKKALDYAHLRGVKIYLTMNTLLADCEMRQALDLVEEAYLLGIDGIIIQDLGLASLIRNVFPELDLHASTQMTIYNLEGVRSLEKLGFKRVVLARELSLDEIEYIAQNTALEIEVFIHGALCISYSGQCLMSSMIGARSGNRGKCAQPCRLPYELVNEGTSSGERSEAENVNIKARYLMSPKDLCSINELKGIISSGVKSLKIEGRMKSPEYVATVVRIYRKYIDQLLEDPVKENNKRIEEEDIKALAQIFNRGGFSTGYLKGKTGREMMCYEKPKNWGIYLGEVVSYEKALEMVKVKLAEDISIGDGVEIWNGEEQSPGNIVTEIKVNGKNVKASGSGEIALLGSLRGKIVKGNKVYKTSDKSLTSFARESFSGKYFRKSSLEGKITIKGGNPAVFTVQDKYGNEARVAGTVIPEHAVNKPLTRERLIEQLGKTGSTPFEFGSLEVELGEGLSLPVSEINDIRRRALEELESRILAANERKLSAEKAEIKDSLLYFPGNGRKEIDKLQISLFCYSLHEDLDYSNFDVDRLYLPFNYLMDESNKEVVIKCLDKRKEVYVWLPSITRGNYDKLIKSKLESISKWGLTGVLAGNPGTLEIVSNITGLQIMGDYTLNVFNSFTVEELSNMNLGGVTLSPELTLNQIADLKEFPELTLEAIVYGRLPVMTSEYCPIGSIMGGGTEKSRCNKGCDNKAHRLRDRMGMEFPIFCDKIDCRSTILNSNTLFVAESLDRIRSAGINLARLVITDESAGEIRDIVNMHRDIANSGIASMNKYNKAIDKIKDKGFTKGHYFRGV